VLPALVVLGAQIVAGQSAAAAGKAEQARQLMAAHRFEEAVPIYQVLAKAEPANPGWLLNLGLAQHMAGKEREAIVSLEALLKNLPDSLPALISLGAARIAVNQPAEAIAPLRKAVNAKPGDTETRGLLASALLEAKQLNEAAAEYRKLTAALSNDPRAWYGLGMAYQASAAAAFEQLQKADPTSPYVSALLAETRVQRRQYRSGFFFYNEAARQLPNLHGIHAALADVYRKTGHADWAAEEDAKERDLPPADCNAHPAECQFAGGHDLQLLTRPHPAALPPEAPYWRAKAANELAIQALFRLGQLPPSAELHQLRAEIARGQGQHMEAARELREALSLTPGDPRIRQELAASLLMAQDYHGALAEAEAMLQAGARSPELDFIAGDRLRLEDPEKAVPHDLNAALAADPKMLAAEASLGLALARLGKQAEALPHLEKALDLDDDGSLYYQLGRAYQAAGQREKAARTMAKYQEIVKKTQEQKEEVAREAQIGPPRLQ
jgi:predicted Zn-dependent protease